MEEYENPAGPEADIIRKIGEQRGLREPDLQEQLRRLLRENQGLREENKKLRKEK